MSSEGPQLTPEKSGYSSTTRRDTRTGREYLHARLLGVTFESWERATAPAPFMIFEREVKGCRGKSVMCARSVRATLNGTDVADSVY